MKNKTSEEFDKKLIDKMMYEISSEISSVEDMDDEARGSHTHFGDQNNVLTKNQPKMQTIRK